MDSFLLQSFIGMDEYNEHAPTNPYPGTNL